MTEQTLHEQLKQFYAEEAGHVEQIHGKYRVDVVRDDVLIEIQTRSFSSIKKKLERLTIENRVRLVHPVAKRKWIVRLDRKGSQVARRKSPKRGRVEEVFRELVYIPELMKDANFELEVALVDVEETLIDDGKGSWRRRRWSIHDRRMLEFVDRRLFRTPEDFTDLLPDSLPDSFTTRKLSKASGLRLNLAQKMVYSLRKMGSLVLTGKKGRANIYSLA